MRSGCLVVELTSVMLIRHGVDVRAAWDNFRLAVPAQDRPPRALEGNRFSKSSIESYLSSNPDVSMAAGQDTGAFGSSLTGLVVFSFSSSKMLAKELLTN